MHAENPTFALEEPLIVKDKIISVLLLINWERNNPIYASNILMHRNRKSALK
jgi:hypothetical protein